MALFNGQAVLGTVLTCHTSFAPKDRQINAYPGVDGLEIIDLGTRGGRTSIEGALTGPDAPTLALYEDNLRSYQADGGAYLFTDNFGQIWGDVVLVMVEVEDRVYQLADGSGVARRYHAELLHLD